MTDRQLIFALMEAIRRLDSTYSLLWAEASHDIEGELLESFRADYREYRDLMHSITARMTAEPPVELAVAIVSPDSPCPECGGDGWRMHPANGRNTGQRCSRGCPSKCSVCRNPDCDNPSGQH